MVIVCEHSEHRLYVYCVSVYIDFFPLFTVDPSNLTNQIFEKLDQISLI